MLPEIISNIVVHPNRDGRLEAFGIGADNRLWHIWQRKFFGTNFQGYWYWRPFDGSGSVGTPAVHHHRDGRLVAFVRTSGDTIWYTSQTSPNSGDWSEWQSLRSGRVVSDPIVHNNRNGRLIVFFKSSTNELTYKSQTSANSDNWTQPRTLGRIVGDTVIVAQQFSDGNLALFRRRGSELLYRRQMDPNSDNWSEWRSFGGNIVGTPTVNHFQDGRLVVFARTLDDHIAYTWQSSPDSLDLWRAWQPINTYAQNDPSSVLTESGHLILFSRIGNVLVELHQTSPNRTNWAPGFFTLGMRPIFSTPNAAVDFTGQIHVFAYNDNNEVLNTVLPSSISNYSRRWSGGRLKNLHSLPGVGINIILVGTHFDQNQRTNIHLATQEAKTIFENADFTIKDIRWWQTDDDNVQNFRVISSDSEAEDLAGQWTVNNDNIDVFVVDDIIGANGQTGHGAGPCNKNAKGMTGIIIQYGGVGIMSQAIAHEIGHYLGLDRQGEDWHNPNEGNLMHSQPYFWNTEITSSQRDVMMGHCFTRDRWD